jgi:hypothetical protein
MDFADRRGAASGPPPRLGNNGRWPRWTPAEDDRLRRAYAAGEPLEQVAAELRRPYRGVATRAQTLGLGGRHAAGRGGWATEREWTEAEDARLREAYGEIPTQQLADELGRPKAGVYNRAFVLGLKHGYHREWTDEEQQALRVAHDRGVSLADLARALGRNYYGVHKYAANRGFRFGQRPRLVVAPALAEILALSDPAIPLPAVQARRPCTEGPRNVRQPEQWPAERKDIFLETLERTGSIEASLAAVRLKASSRKAAYRQKHRDPAFSERWDAALQASPYRPGPPPNARTQREPGPARPRPWADPDRQAHFLEELRRHRWTRAALAAMGLAASNEAQVKRERALDPDFDRRCEEAIALHRADVAVVKAVVALAKFALAPPPKPKPVPIRRPRPRRSKGLVAIGQPAPRAAPPPPPPPPPPAAVAGDRLQLIRSIGQRLQARPAAPASGSSWIEKRMAEIERAKAYLRDRGCRVKSASETRFTYYVTGLAGEYTADQLVDIAQARGMEASS